MAARKTADRPLTPALKAWKSVVEKSAELQARIDELTAALEAQHKLGLVWAAERSDLQAQVEHHRSESARRETIVSDLERELAEVKAKRDVLQDDAGRLTLDLAHAASEIEELKSSGDAQEVKRLRSYLAKAAADAAYFSSLAERRGEAMSGLACLVGRQAAVINDREDEDAATSARRAIEAAR